MRNLIRWGVAVVVVLHGLIHLLGAAKGLGWADVSELKEPISPVMGAVWLGVGALVVLAGILLPMRFRWWSMVGVLAAVASQVVIVTSWDDAKAGTIVNLILLVAAAMSFAAHGPSSYRAEYRRRAHTVLATQPPSGLVTEADLAHLPEPVATYVRRSGAVGLPPVTDFRARVHGRIRAGKDKPWMRFTGEQVNTYGPDPARLFFIDATMSGIPIDVLHVYIAGTATMRVKLCSLVPMVSAAGPEMDRSETVTVFNDLCLLAPAALISAPITWQRIEANRVRGTFTNGTQQVTADLVFDTEGNLVDFISDDRARASQDGTSFTWQRWSTPAPEFSTMVARRLCTRGEAWWHAPDPVGPYPYIEISVDEISYNTSIAEPAPSLGTRGAVLDDAAQLG